MHIIALVVFLFKLIAANYSPDYKEELSLYRRLADHEVVPNMFNITEGYTTEWLNVSYPGIDIQGSYVKLDWIKNEPLKVEWSRCKKDKYYTLMLADIDYVPYRFSNDKHWYAWFIGNIPGPICNITEGDLIFPYLIKGPEHGIDSHRYFYFVWEQYIYDEEFKNPKRFNPNTKRTYLEVNLWAEIFNMDGPVAANYFVLHYD
ncbi:phosphatidylethanolamine-binding protein homolog F40A3.3-like [Planococcus citri]|uniref:phosphatidylethanolamine-binding protein homolog F40A3.3-like n=1 Tax=Planococcus citri TaxID=170843 RepID=UPI0031F7B0BA